MDYLRERKLSTGMGRKMLCLWGAYACLQSTVTYDNIVLDVQVGNVNSIFAGMLRAGLPALLLQLVALLNQPDGAPEASALICLPLYFSLPYNIPGFNCAIRGYSTACAPCSC